MIYLALGFHNHQPVGNFLHVFEEHYRRAYLPFLDTMEAHPGIPFSLHLTGPLLLWTAEHHPEYLDRLRRLCGGGRVEIKGGGFYEPILALIPDADKKEQLERLSRYLEETLGTTPEGAWIAERVWEPQLARHLAQAGLAYAPLDDSHFLSAGLASEDLLGYYVTEEEGHRFDLFPIGKEIRYLIPFQEPGATVQYLKDVAAQRRARLDAGDLPPDTPPPLVVYDDDGEKFGGWPGTHELVYENGWLDRFLGALEREIDAGWLGVLTLGAFRKRYPPVGRAYLPTASYAEMLEWSGGFYRNFLVRYEEANLIHKRMLHASLGIARRLRELEAPYGTPTPGEIGVGEDRFRPDDVRVERRGLLLARDRVLRSQCNDAFWHGIFGGIYLPHLRHAIYSDLVEAERLAGATLRPPVEVVDLDLDGSKEIFLRSPGLTVLVHPRRGGTLVSLDHLATSFALLNTLRRRREPEHAALEALAAAGDQSGPNGTESRSIHEQARMKEPGLERMLFVDALPRAAFMDHFYRSGTGVTELIEGTVVDMGDFGSSPYEVDSVGGDVRAPTVVCARIGTVAGWKVSLRKTISLDGEELSTDSVTVRYEIRVIGPAAARDHDHPSGDHLPAEALFAPEVNLTLLAGWAHDRYVLVDGARPEASFLADVGTHPDASSVTLVDESLGLQVCLSWPPGESREADGTDPPAAESATPEQTGDAAPSQTGTATLLRYGVITVSLSEDGFERVYQSTALVPCLPIRLESGAELHAVLRLEVRGP